MTWAEEIVYEMAIQIVRCMDRRVMLGKPAIPPQPERRREAVRKCRAKYGKPTEVVRNGEP